MKLTNHIFEKKFIKNYNLEINPHIAVAVSGGPDSMALVHLISFFSKKINAKIIALVVNHNLRTESKNEVNWVSNKLESMNINYKILNVSKKKLIKRNMEEARNNRYKKLLSYCNKYKILHLCIAHHYDDIIETYLLRKLSGSNFYGLRSMQNITVKDNICILRPLLDFNKTQIVNYNLKNNIKFLEDPSNNNLSYSRSSVRKFLIENKSMKLDIKEDIKLIDDNLVFYNEIIWKYIFETIYFLNAKCIYIDYKKFIRSNRILKEQIIVNFYKFLNGTSKNLRYGKIDILLTNTKKIDFKVFLIKGMKVVKKGKFLIFT